MTNSVSSRSKTMAVSFKGAHFPQDIILMGVRWYVTYRGYGHSAAAPHDGGAPAGLLPLRDGPAGRRYPGSSSRPRPPPRRRPRLLGVCDWAPAGRPGGVAG